MEYCAILGIRKLRGRDSGRGSGSTRGSLPRGCLERPQIGVAQVPHEVHRRPVAAAALRMHYARASTRLHHMYSSEIRRNKCLAQHDIIGSAKSSEGNASEEQWIKANLNLRGAHFGLRQIRSIYVYFVHSYQNTYFLTKTPKNTPYKNNLLGYTSIIDMSQMSALKIACV